MFLVMCKCRCLLSSALPSACLPALHTLCHVHVVCLPWHAAEMVCAVQGAYEARSIFDSLEIAWSLLRIFPRELLRRVTAKTLDMYYDRESST